MTSTQPLQRRRLLIATCATMLVAVVLGISGCEAPAFVLTNVVPQTIPALYEPEDKPTVVFVDDPRRKLPNLQMNGILANHIGHNLKREEVITDVIPPNMIDSLALNNTDFNTWAIDKVGRRAGAKQVIYVLVEEFDLGEDTKDIAYKPTISVRVKVVDVDTGRRLFPESDELGQPFTKPLFYKPHSNSSRAADQMWSRKLVGLAGDEIATMFYEHEPRGPSGTLPE